jgi:phage baseplate assembly protein W
MAIPQTIRVDPKDLQRNTSLSVSLPFNGPSVFRKVYTTKDRAKYKLINLLLTNEGERLYNSQFGCNLQKHLFDPIIDEEQEALKSDIINKTLIFIPEITVVDINIKSNKDYHILEISISYKMNISGDSDQIIINFE